MRIYVVISQMDKHSTSILGGFTSEEKAMEVVGKKNAEWSKKIQDDDDDFKSYTNKPIANGFEVTCEVCCELAYVYKCFYQAVEVNDGE